MLTKLKLTHDEMVVLVAIADQELTVGEIGEELSRSVGFVRKTLLSPMVESGLLTRKPGFQTLYAIAPDILALNNPPYSYESWRELSE